MFHCAHTGGLAGFVSRVALLPGQRFGVVVLTNAESDAARDAIAWRLIDHAVGEDFDWLGAFDAASKLPGAGDNLDPDKPIVAKSPDARPSMPLARYAGKFDDPWYGGVTITQEGAGLVGQLHCALDVAHGASTHTVHSNHGWSDVAVLRRLGWRR